MVGQHAPVCRLLMLSLALGAVACASAPPAPSTGLQCAAVSGEEWVLAPGAVVVLADVPGTVEAPRFATALACRALSTSRAVTLALDMPREEQAAVDAFLASDGSRAARETLLRGASWQTPGASVARLELLDWVRTVRHGGQPIWVTLLDSAALPPRDAATEREREVRMAAAMLAAADAAPGNVLIGLVGNTHARLVRDTSVQPPYPPMAYLVEQALRAEPGAVYALDARHPTGEAWGCSPDSSGVCGPQTLSGRGELGAPFRVVLGGDVDRSFSGFYQMPSLTPSPQARGEATGSSSHSV